MTAPQINPAFLAIHAGVVVDNEDPDGLGRIKLRVPNLIDVSSWVYPGATIGGGSPQRGVWHMPDPGADVNVFFLGGDPNQPRWFAAHWAKRDGVPEHPSIVSEATDKPAANAHVRCWETEHWVIAMDDRPGERRCWISAKGTTPTVSSPDIDAATGLVFELDLENQTVGISAAGGIAIRTLGTLSLQGSVIQLGERVVLQTTRKGI